LIRIRVTTAPRGATVGRMPTGRSLAPLADVPDGQRRDGGPELVIRRKDAVIPMPVLARRRYEIGEPVEELKRREFDDAISSRPLGLPSTIPPDPVGRLVPREHVADLRASLPARSSQTARRNPRRQGLNPSDPGGRLHPVVPNAYGSAQGNRIVWGRRRI
jgi:hypothetical protein